MNKPFLVSISRMETAKESCKPEELFIETLRIDRGQACNLAYHNRRLNDTLRHCCPAAYQPLCLEDYVHPSPEMDGVKCRVLYGASGIREVTYAPYLMRPVRSLRLVRADEVEYAYKRADRDVLNRLFARREGQDDVLIVRRGLLTDTSIANVALYDGTAWYTPHLPLLKGTRRAALLDAGIIREREIRASRLADFSRLRLFNALIGWGVLELPVSQVFGRD